MDYKNPITALLLIVCLLLPAQAAFAHDPGLSRSRVQVQADGLAIRMVFARQDLVVLDTDRDGGLPAGQSAEVQAGLQSVLSRGVEVQQGGDRLTPKSVRLEQAADDVLEVALKYDTSTVSRVRIHIPLIEQLARGHRQYMVVRDADGKLLGQHILDADSKPVVLDGGLTQGFGVFRQYLAEGVWHIWIGFDHILFLLTLLLPAVLVYRKPHWRSVNNLRPAAVDILKVVTAFTVAHSITLALAVMDVVSLPSRLVESVIALSVLITAANNLRPLFPASRWQLAFAFGLVHGFGFAGVLVELGLPVDARLISLLGFNLGVEAGQLAIVALVFPVTAFVRHMPAYRTWVFSGASAAAALIASVWMFERIFDYEVLGF